MAYQFYVTIEGVKQGFFKGESKRKEYSKAITGLEFLYEVNCPYDHQSGTPTGRRQHSPIQITKEWGAATPQLFQALVTNEQLKSVLFQFVKSEHEGTEQVWYSIRLTNAKVSGLRQYVGNVENFVYDESPATIKLEKVSFVFEKIEIIDIDSKSMAVDDMFE